MKTTRIFAAAFALLSVLSCQKEEQQTINNSENEGGAIITCTFAMNDAATKTTTTDGKTPLWAAEDEIMLYDGSSNTQKLTLAASGTASSTEGIIDGTDATKFTFVKPSGWTNVYAIYPYSACVSGFSASAPKINFAGQDGTFAKANICAAAEISGTMSFKNVGAILEFTSKSVKAAKVVVPVAGLANNFTVSFSGANPSLASESASNSNEFSIGTGYGAVYIGIPAESIAASSVFTYKTSADATLGTYTTGAANTIEANKIYNLGAMMGTLPGLFTVADSKQVQFSKGNLQATYSTSTSSYSWGFAGNQYDYVGNAAGNTTIDSQTNGEVVDLFGWVGASSIVLTGEATKYGISTSKTSTDYGNNASDALKADWGTTIDNNGTWRTLTKDEWTYLLNKDNASSGARTDANRFAKAKVSGVPGLIIFPDGYNGGTKITDGSITGVANVNVTDAAFPADNVTDWSSMESAGCVFLPAAGSRNDSYVNSAGSCGGYWSSVPDGANCAYILLFLSGYVGPSNNVRFLGISVRLVCSAAPYAPVYPEAPELACVKIGDVWWAPVNCGYDATHTYGSLYQWGRKYGQAFELGKLTPETLTKEQGEDSANSGKFGKYDSSTYNWFSGDVDNILWNGSSKGASDPCPTGWRVPTETELSSLYSTKEWITNGGPSSDQTGYKFGTSPNQVFLPAAGSRSYDGGGTESRGVCGSYWSSSVDGNNAKYLGFYDGEALIFYYGRAEGYSVRCVQE